MIHIQQGQTTKRISDAKVAHLSNRDNLADEPSKCEGRLYLCAPSLVGFEQEICRIRAIFPQVMVQTNAQSILDFCDGEQPVVIVFLESSGFLSFSRIGSERPNHTEWFGTERLNDEYPFAQVKNLSREIIRRSLPVSSIVYMRKPSIEEVSASFRSGASDFLSLNATDTAWKVSIQRLWDGWKEKLEKLTHLRKLKSAFERLSPPLKDTAKMLYMGCTNQEIADASNRKLRTIEQRRATIMATLETNNYAELVCFLSQILEKN